MEHAGRAIRVLVAAGVFLLLWGSPTFHPPADAGKPSAYDNTAAADAVLVHAVGSRLVFRPGIAQPLFRTTIKSVMLMPRLKESLAYPAFHEIINPHYNKFLPWSSSSFT